jgi:hypothetical protein
MDNVNSSVTMPIGKNEIEYMEKALDGGKTPGRNVLLV